MAVWSPRELLSEDPRGDYCLSVVVTDADGRNAYADIGFVVKGVIIEEVDLDEE